MSLKPNPKKLKKLYSLYDFYYQGIEIYVIDWEEELIKKQALEDAPSAGRPGRKKSIEEFEVCWISMFVRRFANEQKAAGRYIQTNDSL